MACNKKNLLLIIIFAALAAALPAGCGEQTDTTGRETTAATTAQETPADPVKVFEGWDKLLTEMSNTWTEIDLVDDQYVEINRKLNDAFNVRDFAEMGRLAGEAKVNLDEQARLIKVMRGQAGEREQLVGQMQRAVEGLPESVNRQKLQEIVVKANESTRLMGNAIQNYLQQVNLEYQIVDLFMRSSQGLIDDSTLVSSFNSTRNQSNQFGTTVISMFNEAKALEADTIQAGQYLNAPPPASPAGP